MLEKKNGFFSKLFLKGKFDVVFCALVIILVGIGVTMMYSASYVFAEANKGDAQAFFINQSIFALFGIAVMFIVSKINYEILNNAFFATAFTVVSTILVIIALVSNRGATIKRWIEIGGFSFQPSEFSKFALILALAYLLCKLKTEINDKSLGKNIYSAFILAVVIVFFCLSVLAQSHLSCAILMFLFGVSMMWIGGVKKWMFAVVLVATVVVVVFAIYEIDKIEMEELPYSLQRIKAWIIKPDYKTGVLTAEDKAMIADERYQTIQGLVAIGSGGLFGVGFTNSKQKYLYIPEPQNDFIFTVICEELGLIGAIIILLIFVLLIFRGLKIAINNSNYFASLLCMGIVLQVGIQVFLNIAVVTDLVPNTGISLPFFSYGGSALVMILAEMGVVLGISRTSRNEKT